MERPVNGQGMIMKLYEVMNQEDYYDLYLTEDIKSKLKALGLAGLLSLGLSLGATDVQAKQYNAQELKGMGFTSQQADFISKQPENLQQILINAKKEKEGPAVSFDSNNANAAMAQIDKEDPMITGYSIKGDTIVIQIDKNRAEKGFQNHLQVMKKVGKPPVAKDALSYGGFDDSYKQSVKQKTGAKDVVFVLK